MGVINNKIPWDIRQRGLRDNSRHQKKIKQAIKDNLHNIIAEESIITTDGNRSTKVPIKYLDSYHFKHGQPNDGVGHSQKGKPGDIIKPAQQEDEPGDKAGTEKGHDIYDAEVTLDELVNLMMEDLGLPFLEDKNKRELITTHSTFTDVRKVGIMANWAKRRTIYENFKRNAVDKGKAFFGDLQDNDMRFRTWEDNIERHSNAVIYMMMDRSGSMDDHKKYLCKAMFWWINQFLRRKYEHVEKVFIAHDSEAKVVLEENFFLLSNNGGTVCSSAYELAWKDIKEHRPRDIWNVYCFHFSDGDNYASDNERCVSIIKEMMPRVNMLCYGEVAYENSAWNSDGGLVKEIEKIQDPRLMTAIIKKKPDIAETLKKFLKSDSSYDKAK